MRIKYTDQIIYKTLLEIFKKNFNKKSIKNFKNLRIYDFNEWDSLKNLRLLLEIEKKFKIRLSNDEIAQTISVTEMVIVIKKKL
jgi:acyl carrier protein